VLISSREAAQILAATGLTRERARRVLLAGFAGDGLRTRGSLLYEEKRVRSLVDWPLVDSGVLRETCAQGLFVARVTGLERTQGPDLVAGLALRPWQLSPWASLEMRRVIEAQGVLPLVATVCGFVATGADITAVWPGREGSTLALDEPGAWFEQFTNRRLVTGPGSSWLLWRPRPVATLHGWTLQE
jgi:hypothetical protein